MTDLLPHAVLEMGRFSSFASGEGDRAEVGGPRFRAGVARAGCGGSSRFLATARVIMLALVVFVPSRRPATRSHLSTWSVSPEIRNASLIGYEA